MNRPLLKELALEPFTEDLSDKRKIVVQVWYPSNQETIRKIRV